MDELSEADLRRVIRYCREFLEENPRAPLLERLLARSRMDFAKFKLRQLLAERQEVVG